MATTTQDQGRWAKVYCTWLEELYQANLPPRYYRLALAIIRLSLGESASTSEWSVRPLTVPQLAAEVLLDRSNAFTALRDMQCLTIIEREERPDGVYWRYQPGWAERVKGNPLLNQHRRRSNNMLLNRQPNGGQVSNKSVVDGTTGRDRKSVPDKEHRVALDSEEKKKEAAMLPLDFLQTLERQIGEPLIDKERQGLSRYDRRRLEYAGARVEEEREAGTAQRPKSLFFYLLKNATDEEIAEREEDDGPAFPWEKEDGREAIRRSRAEAEAGYSVDKDSEAAAAEAELQRVRAAREREMLFGAKASQVESAPAQPKELTEEEKRLAEERKAQEERVKSVNRARSVAVGRQMGKVYEMLKAQIPNPPGVAIYEVLMPFFDSPEYLEIGADLGDSPDPVREDYAQRLEQARRASRAS